MEIEQQKLSITAACSAYLFYHSRSLKQPVSRNQHFKERIVLVIFLRLLIRLLPRSLLTNARGFNEARMNKGFKSEKNMQDLGKCF